MRLVVWSAAAVLGGCGTVTEPGTPLEPGQWRMKTEFATPKIDGLTDDSMRQHLPADRDETQCRTPTVRTGARVMELFNLRQNACKIETSVVADGAIAAEGQCPELARLIAGEAPAGPGENASASWIKIAGTYAPRYLKVDADIVLTLTSPRGDSSRLTTNATYTAERTGDCS